jgi:NTE family protein
MGLRLSSISLALALLLTGCAHYPVNTHLAAVDAQTGYRFQNAASPTNSQELLLMLAFSGGGTRAAALSYGVLEELARTPVGPPNGQHPLLEEVDLISSVSGGSFTAAYYALWGNRIFTDFEPRFLKQHVQSGLFLRSLNPWNRLRLFSPTFCTSDLASEYYNHLLFDGATFGDLAAKPGRPFLIINASDIALGTRFEFTQDQFDLIHSDLSTFPIARAVAASAAYPVLLSPIVLRNYSAGQSQEPEWIRAALTDPTASTPRVKHLALQARSYSDGQRRRFVHLLDGGLTDNLGLRGSLDRALVQEGTSGPLLSPFLEKTRRLAVIIVDAHVEPDYGWDSKERSPRLPDLVGSIAQVPISRYSFETIELFKEAAPRLARELRVSHGTTGAEGPAELTLYIVELHFSQALDESDCRFFNSVPTRLQLPASTVDRLRRIAARELAGNAEFRRLVGDLRGSRAPEVSSNSK